MTFVRRMMTAGATMLLGYAMKKFMEKMQAQAATMAEAAKQRAEEARDPSEFKKLKQDPATGEYYAED